MTLRGSTGEPGGAKAQRRTPSMTFLVLGSTLVFISGIRFATSVCRPLQGRDPLRSVRRAHPSIAVTREPSGLGDFLRKDAGSKRPLPGFGELSFTVVEDSEIAEAI